MSGAWLRALTYTVTVKRSSQNKSASGATRYVYDQVIASGLACSIQDDGGRQVADEFGNIPSRKKKIIADVDFEVVRQNDLLVDDVTGQTYKVFHTHYVNNPNAPHYEAQAEEWVPSGDA